VRHPDEFDARRIQAAYYATIELIASVRFDLLKAGFDALAYAADFGPKQVVAF